MGSDLVIQSWLMKLTWKPIWQTIITKPGRKNPFSPELQQTYPKSPQNHSKAPLEDPSAQLWQNISVKSGEVQMEDIIYQAKRMKESPFTLW